jgi:hypothetical protein
MADLKHCEFFLLRYVPDVVKGEPVNIGVVLLEDGDEGFTDIRFRQDWRRVRCADPDVDIELLESYETELRRLLQSREPEVINYRGPMSRREWLLAQMEESWSSSLELAPGTAIRTESPSVELGVLAQAYLDSPARVRRVQSGRRVVYNAMRSAFEAAGVWPFMRQDIPVARYTKPGDPLKIDCGYRPNGVVHLYHALSLATNLDSAKVLAFSYAQMVEGFMKEEHAMCDLTVITENGLDLENEEIAYAHAALEAYEIAVARVAEMPQIAERARLELKL